MFKRRFGHRPRSKKLETRAHAARAFKRKVTQKVININVKCQTICTLPGATCPNGGKHILVASQEVFGQTGNFNDAIRIARLEGVLYMRPDYSRACEQSGECGATQGCLDNPVIFRMGLLKSRVQQALGGIPVAVNPLADGVDPFHLSDAADSRFLKTWDHLWTPTRELHCMFTTQPVMGFKAPGYTVPALDGVSPGAVHQDGYVVPPDVCDICEEQQVAGTIGGTVLKLPSWHAFRISYRRPIVLKENDDLNLWFGWESMRDCDDEHQRPEQVPMQTCGHVFMTVET